MDLELSYEPDTRLASIIIPMYNAAEHIKDCLNSIIIQYYKNIEVIIVDDGSTDDSMNTVNQFIKDNNEKRIRLYTQANAGPAAARNQGIELVSSNSKMLFFVDSDDRIAPDYISMLSSQYCGDNLVCGKLYRCNRHNMPLDITKPDVFNYNDIWSNDRFLSSLSKGIINSSCCKCYNIDIIRKHKIRFPEGFPEDAFFNVEYLKHLSKFTYIDKFLYYYIESPNSITTKPDHSVFDNYIKLQTILLNSVCPKNRKFINQLVYPQYRGLIIKFLERNIYEIATTYRKRREIKNAFKSYRSKTVGDYIAHKCLYFGWFKLYRRLFIKSHVK